MNKLLANIADFINDVGIGGAMLIFVLLITLLSMMGFMMFLGVCTIFGWQI